MGVFDYKIFSVAYKRYLKNTYIFALITKDKKILHKDYVVCNNENDVQVEILKKLEFIFSKHKIGLFRIEIYFIEKIWQPCVNIWLPSDEVICEELKMKEKNLLKILALIKNMLTNDIIEYKNFYILDYQKYGNNLQQKNFCGFSLDFTGKYICLFDDNLNDLKFRIDTFSKQIKG
ncbi:MAG: hypothetical protein IJW82_05175 [Clostridia bacterium]|nr:hypothetical protein [Clostridia bacterium]